MKIIKTLTFVGIIIIILLFYVIFFNKEKIIIANVSHHDYTGVGGLGNQFITFSCAYAYAKSIGAKQIFIMSNFTCGDQHKQFMDPSNRCYGLDKFGIHYPVISDIDSIKNKYGKKIYMVNYLNQLRFKSLFDLHNIIIFNVRFDIKLLDFIKNYKKEIKELFNYQESLSKKAYYFLNQIKSSESISLHIRRGDYISLNADLPLSYYIKATYFLYSRIHSPKVFIFSDDVAYVKKYFSNINNIKKVLPLATTEQVDVIYKMLYQDAFYVSQEVNHSLEEFYLMSNCKHNIIANSTFSWWAAFLNKNPTKIVTVPSSYTVMDYPKEENWNKIEIS